MFRQNSRFKQNAHLMICVIPVSGKLMEVALPGILMHAQNVSKMGILTGRACDLDARQQCMSTVLTPT